MIELRYGTGYGKELAVGIAEGAVIAHIIGLNRAKSGNERNYE